MQSRKMAGEKSVQGASHSASKKQKIAAVAGVCFGASVAHSIYGLKCQKDEKTRLLGKNVVHCVRYNMCMVTTRTA
jgi:hypothetical protein